MSHFTVLVVLPPTPPDKVDDALNTALAPFDENLEVTPYKEYVTDWQADYESALAYFTENPKEKPAGLDELSAADVLSAYHGDDVHEESKPDSDVVMFYTWRTYNPQSKWDWWTVGGRWRDYFPVKYDDQEAMFAKGLIRGTPSWTNEKEFHKAGYVDGGPRKLLDFDRLRDLRGAEATTEYDKWTAYIAGLPEALPFTTFVDSTDDIEEARRQYHAQPVLEKIAEDRRTGSRDFDYLFSDPVEKFSVTRQVYVQLARDRAVPGYSVLDLEGHWIAAGEMGWWGLSSDGEADRIAYHARANEYLDSLPPDTIVVAVDAHI